MRITLKLFNSRIKGKTMEKWGLLKKRTGKWWDRFIEKGHEKMTVMFIPHNERKIFNFQISKFTVSFFVLLFMVVIATSTYAVIKNTSIKREEERLLTNYKDIRSQLIRFEKLTDQINSEIDDMKPEIEELYELATGNDEYDDIWMQVAREELSDEDLKKLANILPSEVFTLRKMQKDLICTTNTIKTVKNFIDVRNKVINDTPSIVPNRGHITSLFGWRRSPFGFGRDFHTGIDIAAPHGTEIRATAPGKVMTSGWGGGYGYMVRVKHKYGFESIYGHCSRITARQGDYVRKGQVIGYVGQTGSATGNHCHYEIRLGNVAINPYPYMSRMW